MVAKTIIEVDVKDDAFKAFQDRFKKYQDMLKAMPGDWGDLDKGVLGTATTVAAITVALAEQAELLHQQEDAGRKLEESEKKQLDLENKRKLTVHSIWQDTVKIAKQVSDTTLDLFKWAGIGGILGGLAGAGGLWGLDNLAHGVSDARRSAQGLGVTTGQQQAMNINYQRYLNVNSNLENIAEAKADYSKRWAFSAMGVNPQGKDPAQLALDMVERAKTMFDHSDQSQQFAQSHGLLQFYTMDELRRLHSTSMADLRASHRQYDKDVGDIGLGDETNRKWQEFSIQMGRASQTIKNVFVDAMTPLAQPGGPLDNFSKSLAATVKTFLSNPHMKDWIDGLAAAINKFAVYLASPKFQQDVKTFVDDIAILAYKITQALVWLKLIPDPSKDTEDSHYKLPHKIYLNPFSKEAQNQLHGFNFRPVTSADIQRAMQGLPPLAANFVTGLSGQDLSMSSLLNGIHYAESRNGRRAGYSSAGALGDYQLMPKTAAQYGVTDRRDVMQSRIAAGRYVADLLKEFHGDVRKALAAYNWGQGHVESDIQRHGANWEKFAAPGVHDYINSVLANGRGSAVTIVVENKTGADIHTQARQAVQ